jgi:uncharacterized protein (DUF849 family)
MEWLDGYDQQTPGDLVALQATHRVDSIVLAFEQALQLKAMREGEASLSATERAVLAIEAMEREVNNGGCGQLFINEPDERFTALPSQLTAIGCPVTASLAAQALAARDNPDALAPLDGAYYNAGEDIAGQLLRWLEARLDDIRFAPPA